MIVVDVSCDTVDMAHADQLTSAIGELPGVTVRKVSDRTFLLHLGGKIGVNPKVPLRNRDDLSRAYILGVARVCMAIARNPADARRLTIKRNTVAVVTDGTAVLGLGDIGPAAAMPVMEGKAALFKQFAGVDAWPVALDTKDTDEIVMIVKALAPAYGGINLEDIFPALFRDRATPARPAGHPGLPRRPARHRDRGAGRTDQRVASGRQAARGREVGHESGLARPATRSSRCCTSRATATSSAATGTARSSRATRTSTRSAGGSPTTPTPAGCRARCARCWPARMCSSASPPRTC